MCVCVFFTAPARQRAACPGQRESRQGKGSGPKGSGKGPVVGKFGTAAALIWHTAQEGPRGLSPMLGCLRWQPWRAPHCWPGCRQDHSWSALRGRGLLEAGGRPRRRLLAEAGPACRAQPDSSLPWKPSGGPRPRSPGEVCVMPSSS